MQDAAKEKEIVIKPCNHKQLAAAYGVSPKVLRTWLRPHQQQIGKRTGHKYSLEQLFLIFDKIGWPTKVSADKLLTSGASIPGYQPGSSDLN